MDGGATQAKLASILVLAIKANQFPQVLRILCRLARRQSG
jgi:hypothetical protein